MTDWQFFAALRHAIQHDPAGRGLDRVAGRSLISSAAPDLEAACRSLAVAKKLHCAIITGFYIPQAESYETDGPLGAIFLAETLHRFGAGVTLISEPGCNAALEIALRLNGLEDHVLLADLPAPDSTHLENWVQRFWQQHPQLTHLVSVERVGPSHHLQSLFHQYGEEPAPLKAFVHEVDATSWNRPHNMRGHDIGAFTSGAYRLFETMPAGVKSIGIGDGGNEIGMGRILWDIIRTNIQVGGKIACRVPTHHLVVAGTSNWGAYALAAGLVWLKQQVELASLFDADREAQLWEAVLAKEPLVDGVTAACQLTVDGLEYATYRQPMDAMQQLLSQQRSVEHGVQRFPSLHG